MAAHKVLETSFPNDIFYVTLNVARMAQSEAFGSVISFLRNHPKEYVDMVKRSCKDSALRSRLLALRKLRPLVVDDGLLCVGGHL